EPIRLIDGRHWHPGLRLSLWLYDFQARHDLEGAPWARLWVKRAGRHSPTRQRGGQRNGSTALQNDSSIDLHIFPLSCATIVFFLAVFSRSKHIRPIAWFDRIPRIF